MKVGSFPSPALIVAICALLVALSGTALALPGRNSVEANDIARDAVKAKHIRDAAVGAGEIRDGEVRAAEIAAGAVGSGTISDGAVATEDLAAGATAPNADRLDGVSSEDILAPRAIAHVNAGEIVISPDSAGELDSTQIERDGTNGFACINVPYDVRVIQVTVDLSGGGADPVAHATTADIGPCPGAEDASYAVTDPDTDAPLTSTTNVYLTLYD